MSNFKMLGRPWRPFTPPLTTTMVVCIECKCWIIHVMAEHLPEIQPPCGGS